MKYGIEHLAQPYPRGTYSYLEMRTTPHLARVGPLKLGHPSRELWLPAECQGDDQSSSP
jgi:hypothetical protein